MHLCQRLNVRRVTVLLVTSYVDSCFRGVRHVSFPGWLRRFKCLGQLPINSGIPPLPSTFSEIFLRLKPRLEVSPRL